jgi:hypothetical protein
LKLYNRKLLCELATRLNEKRRKKKVIFFILLRFIIKVINDDVV